MFLRVAGLDVGDRTIGVAVSDGLGLTAQGLGVIRRTDLKADLERLKAMATEHEISRWVVGLPKNMNGTLGPRAALSQKFAVTLEQASGLPVELVDERLTTMAAERTLIEGGMSRKRRRQVVDQLAAQLILQTYLDRLRAQGQKLV